MQSSVAKGNRRVGKVMDFLEAQGYRYVRVSASGQSRMKKGTKKPRRPGLVRCDVIAWGSQGKPNFLIEVGGPSKTIVRNLDALDRICPPTFTALVVRNVKRAWRWHSFVGNSGTLEGLLCQSKQN